MDSDGSCSNVDDDGLLRENTYCTTLRRIVRRDYVVQGANRSHWPQGLIGSPGRIAMRGGVSVSEAPSSYNAGLRTTPATLPA